MLTARHIESNRVGGDRYWDGVAVIADIVEHLTGNSSGIACPNTVRINGVELYNPACDPVVVERVERIVAGVPGSSVLRLTVTALAFCTVADAPGAETPALLGDGTAGGVFELVLPPDYRWGTPGAGERLRPDVGVFVNDAQHSVAIHVSADDPVVVGPPVDPRSFHGVVVEREPVRVTLTLLCERLTFGHDPAHAATR